MIVQCCVCGKTRQGGIWRNIATPLGGQVSHGYCPVCAEVAFKELTGKVKEGEKPADSASPTGKN